MGEIVPDELLPDGEVTLGEPSHPDRPGTLTEKRCPACGGRVYSRDTGVFVCYAHDRDRAFGEGALHGE